ncbi:MAG: NifU N-terminal domain-containing protein [Acidimicrobiia bacterium]
MPVVAEPTPNPNARKFTVGKPVGGPATFTVANAGDDPAAADLLAIDGVTSVFMTADFVTVTKTADVEWTAIEPAATEILNRRFG